MTHRPLIDLSASSARVRSARALAAAQARLVEDAGAGADKRSIDLLFLVEESVLVMTETHAMLEGLAKNERGVRLPTSKHRPLADRWLRPARRAASSAALLAVMIVVAAWALEVLDPAPMDVEAGIVRFFRPIH